jgi:hypothetical protein
MIPAEGDPGQGRRVEYVITSISGGRAEIQAVHDETDQRRLPVGLLTRMLGLDRDALAGRRFSGLVVPDEYGTTFSDCQLIPEQ